MTVIAQSKKLVEKLTGLKIYRRLPFGVNQFQDIKYLVKNFQVELILDVGANEGQTANQFIKFYPQARIFCIEPVLETFQKLKNNVKAKNVSCHNLALGSENGSLEIKTSFDNSNSTMNSLKALNMTSEGKDFKTEKVNVMTLDTFCKEHGISEISYLKIDTEGFDLEVLKGGISMLEQKRIGFIEVEAGMNPDNKYHVSFDDLKGYLEGFDYYLFGLYEQFQEWIIQKPILRRCNPLFISKSLAYKFG
jgi:FkbM family methyltransferase